MRVSCKGLARGLGTLALAAVADAAHDLAVDVAALALEVREAVRGIFGDALRSGGAAPGGAREREGRNDRKRLGPHGRPPCPLKRQPATRGAGSAAPQRTPICLRPIR